MNFCKTMIYLNDKGNNNQTKENKSKYCTECVDNKIKIFFELL